MLFPSCKYEFSIGMTISSNVVKRRASNSLNLLNRFQGQTVLSQTVELQRWTLCPGHSNSVGPGGFARSHQSRCLGGTLVQKTRNAQERTDWNTAKVGWWMRLFRALREIGDAIGFDGLWCSTKTDERTGGLHYISFGFRSWAVGVYHFGLRFAPFGLRWTPLARSEEMHSRESARVVRQILPAAQGIVARHAAPRHNCNTLNIFESTISIYFNELSAKRWNWMKLVDPSCKLLFICLDWNGLDLDLALAQVHHMVALRALVPSVGYAWLRMSTSNTRHLSHTTHMHQLRGKVPRVMGIGR